MNISRVHVALLVGAILLIAGCKTKSWSRDQLVGHWCRRRATLLLPEPRRLQRLLD